jgi:hypothetical protein
MIEYIYSQKDLYAWLQGILPGKAQAMFPDIRLGWKAFESQMH